VLSVQGEGDALVVTRLDRLGRSLRDLANIAHEIEQAGAHLKVIEQDVDTSTDWGRAFFGMLAVFAAFETDVRRERQLEGIAMAKRLEAPLDALGRIFVQEAFGHRPLEDRADQGRLMSDTVATPSAALS
jgi:DNA invertase Pin-like site-specific DNA recombinase